MKRRTEHHRTKHLALRAALLLTFVAVLIWWVLPATKHSDDFDLDAVITVSSPSIPPTGQDALHVTPEMFAVQLWYTPLGIEEPKPVVSEPQVAKIKLQLIAITEHPAATNGHKQRSAILYDPTGDILLEVIAGQTIGRIDVVDISEIDIRLSAGQRETVLSLNNDEGGR